MPTPYGSRGGMAFSADELRVLRRALAIALQPEPVTPPGPLGPDRAEEVQDCFRLAEAVDEAVREGGRLRAFLLDELARYRAALPGAAVGYLEQLEGALAAGYEPLPEDLAALRTLCRDAASDGEAERRRALLSHCERLAERCVRARLATPAVPPAPARSRLPEARLRALPGGVGAARGAVVPQGVPEPLLKDEEPKQEPRKKPTPAPDRGDREEPKRREPGRGTPRRPQRPVPTPAEVFPPKRRRPSPPPDHESRLGPGPSPGVRRGVRPGAGVDAGAA
ncbi:hypothetical protein [Streptomyces sp. NBRC 110028]|uniref:hypothetical protein n=1 Tax=Streptomyces sp. NBRC 110028 TaxID=1621260 RepID=UPI001F229963|nr:hypothetical protein [Streptomyces sp. NBRC 110028]